MASKESRTDLVILLLDDEGCVDVRIVAFDVVDLDVVLNGRVRVGAGGRSSAGSGRSVPGTGGRQVHFRQQ